MKMKYLPLLGVLSALALTGCGKKGSEPSGETKTDQKIDIQVINSEIQHSKDYFAVTPINMHVLAGGTAKINIEAIPSVYAGEQLTFTSMDATVATVDAEGNVSGVAPGTTKIEVSSKDGQAKETLFVYVNESIEKSVGAERLQAKNAAIMDPSFEKIGKLKAHEFVKQTVTIDGKAINTQSYVEDIIFSKEDAYFEVTSDDIEIRTADGSPAVSCGKWMFFVDQESYDTYLLHDTPTAKNYMEVHTQKYLGKPAYQIIYDVMDMFFVSGSEIVTDLLDDADGYGLYDTDSDGEGLFLDCAKTDYSNAKEVLFAPNEEDLYCELEITQTASTIKPKEEFSIDIPAGTVYDEADKYCLFLEGDIVKGFNILANMVFEWDGKDASRVFEKQTQFIRDFDIEIPDLSNYTLVDSVYDL